MRKKALILIVCLVICALFLQALPYGVTATANPTAAGLAEFAIKAYQEGWGYVYGTYGQMITQTIIDGKARQYPGNFNSVLSDGRTIYQTAQKWIGHRAADCVGLMKAYLWWQGDAWGPAYNSAHDRSANGTFEAATVKGPVNTIPDTHGICLWRDGHVGVYIGNGWVIESRGTAYGVVMTRLSDRGWTHWFQYPYVSYSANGWMTIAGQTYYYSSGTYLTGIQTIDSKTYNFGGDGVLTQGMALDGGKLRYFRTGGELLTGWQMLDNEKYYFDADGYACTGWTKIDGQQYLFSKNGILLTGWQTENDKIYYLDGDGIARTGQQDIDGRQFWFSPGGELLTGWQSDLGGPRYRDLSSQPVTGLQMIDGKTWLFDEDGRPQVGVQTLKGTCSSGESIEIALQFTDDGRLMLPSDTDFTLDKTSQILMINDDPAQGQGQLLPQNPLTEGDLPLTWLSFDPSVAVVTAEGLVQAVGNGQTLVMARSAAGHTAACIITVLPDSNQAVPADLHHATDKPLLGLAISRSNLNLPVGAKTESFAEIIYSDCPQTVTFVSSQPTVASVSADGTIRGLSHGTAVITATAGDFSASCTVTVSGTYPTLRRGNSGEQVRDLQQRLTELGYIVGPVDGSFGPLTEFGVLCFQKNLGLTLTGTADHALRLALQVDTAPLATALQGESVLQPDDRGEAVYVLQQRLTDLGFFKGIVSGQYDSLTIQAVQTMRIINNLPTADYADLTLISRLLGQKIIAGRATLEPGFSGYEAELLQTRLQALQYYAGMIDGYYNDDVTRAVKAFQFQHGLSVDGLAGPATQRALFAATAQPCTPDALKAVTLTTLRSGMTGDAVKILEDRLVELGYHLSLADNAYDGLTASSISAFQKRCGLSQTGVADIMTQLRLFDEMAKTSLSVYRYGSRGTSVQRIQTRLNQLGFNCGKVDGSFGRKTQNSVRNFQTQAGLPIDGQAAWTTLARLFAADAPTSPVAAAPAATASVTVFDLEVRLVELGYLYAVPDGISNSMTVSALKAFQRRSGLSQTGSLNSATQTGLFSSAAPVSTSVYKYGSRGTTVKYIQTRLNQLGFNCGRIDGSFGSKTRNAVKAFQVKAGLNVTGTVNYVTAAALFALTAPQAG